MTVPAAAFASTSPVQAIVHVMFLQSTAACATPPACCGQGGTKVWGHGDRKVGTRVPAAAFATASPVQAIVHRMFLQSTAACAPPPACCGQSGRKVGMTVPAAAFTTASPVQAIVHVTCLQPSAASAPPAAGVG